MNKQIFRMLLVLFFVVVCVSAGVIYFTFDRRALDYLTTFRPQYALLALFLLGVGLFFDGTRLITLTHLSDEKMDYKHVFNVVFSNYFLALLTPGQGGGGIAQLMFMKKAGVSVAKSTLIIIVRTVMSILFLFLTVPVVFYFDPSLVSWMPPSVIALVCAFFIFAPGMLIYCIVTGRFEKWLVRFCRRFSPKVRKRSFFGTVISSRPCSCFSRIPSKFFEHLLNPVSACFLFIRLCRFYLRLWHYQYSTSYHYGTDVSHQPCFILYADSRRYWGCGRGISGPFQLLASSGCGRCSGRYVALFL